ncbi:hypothetical protein F7734_08785 [Scytonema sp. UIC 10036]|uniref:hypothetical protein n=1 Tax=Scytonema sp. UIC 10036 TaxID=2304196 RepID=UPI0012DA9B3E|nr:hypothetical protein [Scytonema sp. UIC 10036]MUG92550.1 hypothetical protein [Scytonema sp. UIC 10036]
MQKRKLNISMMLKVPIDLEIEVAGVPPINNQPVEDNKENQKLFNFIGESEPEAIVNGVSLAELDEDSQVLVSELIGQLEQKGKIFSTLSQIQYKQENLGNDEQEIAERQYEDVNTLLSKDDFTTIQPQTQLDKKKMTTRILDSFNDGFTLLINTMGTVLFLGKLANYSWE